MARTPYTGTPDAVARTSVPDDYSNVQPRIGTGLEQLGEGFSQASRFFGQAAADNAFNNYQDGVTKLLYGDPAKQMPGADGQPVEDTGYMGMKGRQALDARPGVEQSLQSLFSETRASLQTPEQQQQFDNYARRYRAEVMSRIGSHSDQAATTWYGDVNSASEKLALDSIARNANDPQQFATASADLINARVKQAQLAGAQPGDALYNEAVASGKRDALKTQVLAISATDPSSAMRILEKNQNIAGVDYEPLKNALRSKADQADGEAAGAAAISGAHQSATVAAQEPKPNTQTGQMFSGLEQKNRLPSGYLARTMQIESGGRNLGPNSAGAAGYFQFIPSTAARMGVDPHSLQSSADGAARLASDNARYLRTGLGREPTGGELYLAHQQGAKGAYELLSNPNASAASIVGTKAVIQNGGREGMTAGEFANMWINKFNGTKGTTNAQVIANPSPQGTALPDMRLQPTAPQYQSLAQPDQGVAATAPEAPAPTPVHSSEEPVQPLSLKADAYQSILDDKDLSPGARAHAIQFVNQALAAQQMVYEANQREKKEKNAQTANGFVQRMLRGDTTNIVQDIANAPDLDWETRRSLGDAALKQSKDEVEGMPKAYGPGFWDAYKAVTAEPGNPERITDIGPLLRRAGPGGDLSLAGVEKLQQVMTQANKDPDQQAVSGMQKATLDYIKHNISFEADYGTYKIPDPAGMDTFNAKAIPAFWKAYEDGTNAGKTPFQLLSKDSPDYIGDKIISAYKRSSAQEMKDRIAAGDDATGNAAAQAQPPAPGTFDLETPEGIVAAFKAGSLSRADAGHKLDQLRAKNNGIPNQ